MAAIMRAAHKTIREGFRAGAGAGAGEKKNLASGKTAATQHCNHYQHKQISKGTQPKNNIKVGSTKGCKNS